MDKIKKAIIYARCSTEENRQDVEVQLKELRRYCEAYGWNFDEVAEYGSGYKTDTQPKLKAVLEKIRRKHYDIFLCFSVDRFSRQHPSKINALLDQIVERHQCRFVALQQGIDSDNEIIWAVAKPLFVYFANKYSRDLGEKIRRGIERKKELGRYNGGRPRKQINDDDILSLRQKGMSIRQITKSLNETLPRKQRISYQTVHRYLSQKLPA